ncbi:MAG: potassium-transporting ATPase subunit KdpA, partial [Thermoanaerobaculia bacterium]
MAFLKVALFFLLLLALTKPIGLYMRRVFSGERTFLDPLLRPIERLIYRLSGIDPAREQTWKAYTLAMLVFNTAGLLLLFGLQRLQHVLPLNPDKLGAVAPDLAWNTAVSFTTNTNWQAYTGEATMSHLTQMAGLAFHNFTSAATGIAIAIAVIRGIARQKTDTLGNFWVDLVRSTLWILLPISLVGAIVLMSQGVVQNFSPSIEVQTLEGATQKIAQGPVASQEAIKELGTNGGGFFNANSAHPYENPTPLSNLV